MHREAKTLSDKVAMTFVRLLRYGLCGSTETCAQIFRRRWGFDIASGYKHKPIPPNSNMTLEELRKGGYVMDERQWLQVNAIGYPTSAAITDPSVPPILAYPFPRKHRGCTRICGSNSPALEELALNGMCTLQSLQMHDVKYGCVEERCRLDPYITRRSGE